MHQIQLSDQLYEQAQRRALEAGFSSVDEFVADVVQQHLIGDAPGETASDEQLALEWTEELDRHIADYRCGSQQGVNPQAMLADVRNRLAASRNPRKT